MRRRSLAGPLLLVLIGVWFLMSTLRPDLPLLDLAARFWPFILIGWGALRLLEILVWAVRGQALPRSGLAGGEWTLVVFVCLIGSGLYWANFDRPWGNWVVGANRVEIFGRSFDYTIPEQKVPVGKATRVLVENLHGTVRVTGADTQEVTAGGRKSIRALQDKDADEADRQTPVEAAVNGDQVVVRTNQDRLTGQQRVTTDVEVTVPRGFTVEVRGRNNDSIEVSAVNGGVEVAADEASVRLENIGGSVRLSDVHKSELIRAANVKGGVDIQGGHGRDIELDTIGGEVVIDGSYSGDLELRNLAKPLRIVGPNAELRVERTPGEIHMDLGKFEGTNLVGPIRLTSTRARDVEIEKFTQSLDLSLDHGDITLRPLETPLSKIDAHTHNGQVDLTLPEKAAFDLKASTNHGEVSNDYGDALKAVSEEHGHDRGSIQGTIGQGPAIVVETDRGSVTVRKDSGAPLAAHNEKPSDEHIHPEIEKH
ncbi:MAG: DUF4097 family beta strand repeat-containing protein [Bryobacteraceae bacterium]|jgi:DUF4097 and DUF4098 domain-containing protein YvlB